LKESLLSDRINEEREALKSNGKKNFIIAARIGKEKKAREVCFTYLTCRRKTEREKFFVLKPGPKST